MGTFYTRIGVANPLVREFHWVDVLVDTGATHSMLPTSLLEQVLRVPPRFYETYRIANGAQQRFPVGQAEFKIGDKELTAPVLFGPENRQLLGAVTLQVFELIPDTTNHCLIPAPESAHTV
jgi:predicted aspartyl protease